MQRCECGRETLFWTCFIGLIVFFGYALNDHCEQQAAEDYGQSMYSASHVTR